MEKMLGVAIEFQGPYEDAFDLVDELRAAGYSVAWDAPDRERSDMLQDICVGLVVSGTIETVSEVVKAFLARHRASSTNLQQPADGSSDGHDSPAEEMD